MLPGKIHGAISRRPVRIWFADFWHDESPGAIRANPLYRLLDQRFDLQLVRDPDFLIYSCFGRRHLNYDCTRIFYTGENVRPDFERCDFAFSFDYPGTGKNYRLPLYRLYDNYDRIDEKGREVPDPAGRRFCNFLYSNSKATERLAFLDHLNRYKRVDCGGRLRNNIGYRVRNKLEFISGYKFTIAFENSSHPGYTTEKLLEALIADTIPIYWGNPLVARDFNPDGYINVHDYENFEQVVTRIAEVDRDDELYRQYIRAPVFPGGVEPEALQNSAILDRFDQIFSMTGRSGAARPSDRLRYFTGLGNTREWARRTLRALSR